MLRRTANPHLAKQWLLVDPTTGQHLGFTGSRSDVIIERTRRMRHNQPHLVYELHEVHRYTPTSQTGFAQERADDEEEE